MKKQKQIIADVNMMSGHVTFEYLAEKYGKPAIERCLSRGFIRIDESGYLHICESVYQHNPRRLMK